TARLWAVASGKPLGPPFLHQESVRAAAFSPDGQTILTGSLDKTARLWDVVPGDVLGVQLRHQAAVYAVAFSPDGRTIATGGNGGATRLWEPAAGTRPRILVEAPFAVYRVAFSPDGKTLLIASWDDGRRWDAATGKPLGQPLPFHGLLAIAYAPDGQTI